MKLTDTQKLVLSKCPDDNALWTGDIAYDCRVPTPKVRNAIEALWRRGLVVQVVQGGKGLPSSWRRTPAGRAALKETHHAE